MTFQPDHDKKKYFKGTIYVLGKTDGKIYFIVAQRYNFTY